MTSTPAQTSGPTRVQSVPADVHGSCRPHRRLCLLHTDNSCLLASSQSSADLSTDCSADDAPSRWQRCSHAPSADVASEPVCGQQGPRLPGLHGPSVTRIRAVFGGGAHRRRPTLLCSAAGAAGAGFCARVDIAMS